MIDIHCHLLPGVDDGAESLAEALEMCRQAVQDGCTAMVATPHQRHPAWVNEDRDHLEELHRSLCDLVKKALDLRLGAEIRVDSQLLPELELDGSPLLPLAGSRYLLLELPRREMGPSPEELIHELQLARWRPILAHPELIPYLAADLDRLRGLVAAGAMLQVTAMSVTGETGGGAHAGVWEMLTAGLVHFVASDCHSSEWRSPGLSEARNAIAAELGPRVARQLVADNPARILADETPPP